MPAFRTPFESSTNACVHAEVPSRRPQSLPLGHHFGARQSHQSHAAAASTDTTYTSVVEACQFLEIVTKIRRRREESDRGELHQGGLRTQERYLPGFEMAPCPVTGLPSQPFQYGGSDDP